MLPTALQVYSVRTDAERDLAGTLAAVKSYGYDGVELAGLYGKSAKEFAHIVAASGLEPVSAHFIIADMRRDLDGIIRDYREIGCKHLVATYPFPDERPGTPGWEPLVRDLRVICERLTDAGFTVSYHNHDFEFLRDENGVFYLDRLYSEIPGELIKVELDVFWADISGADPAEYLAKYRGRIPLVHLKDRVGDKSGFEYRPLGEGTEDLKKIVASAVSNGAEWLIAEQDEPSQGLSRLECARISAEYLKKEFCR